jgi:sulfur relay (sulfurtransferase) complex TusBCD TusD component (DsrE family)
MMNRRLLGLGVAASLVAASMGARAEDAGAPLFINLTSDDPHRVRMAVGFGAKQQERAHGLTIFLNDRAVHVASTRNAATFAEQQKMLAAVLAAGGKVLVCPMCMEHYGVAKTNLAPGLEVGSPEVTGAALFAEDSRTLTW